MDPARDSEKTPTHEQPKFSKRFEDAPVLNAKTNGTNYLKWGGLAAIAIIALVLIIILGGRAITGYNTYSAMTESGVPEQYATDMTALATAKSAAETEAAAAQAAADEAEAKLNAEVAKITQERESHAATKAALQSDLEKSRETSNALQEELQTKESAFEDSSRRLCCIQRVLDPKITGYAITTEGNVACVTDGSGTDVSC